MTVILSSALLFLAACGNGAKATTMKLAGTQGTVDVADAKEDVVALIENLPLYSGYQVGTQADSYAWIIWMTQSSQSWIWTALYIFRSQGRILS